MMLCHFGHYNHSFYLLTPTMPSTVLYLTKFCSRHLCTFYFRCVLPKCTRLFYEWYCSTTL